MSTSSSLVPSRCPATLRSRGARPRALRLRRRAARPGREARQCRGHIGRAVLVIMTLRRYKLSSMIGFNYNTHEKETEPGRPSSRHGAASRRGTRRPDTGVKGRGVDLRHRRAVHRRPGPCLRRGMPGRLHLRGSSIAVHPISEVRGPVGQVAEHGRATGRVQQHCPWPG